jgi:hypothetical protein
MRLSPLTAPPPPAELLKNTQFTRVPLPATAPPACSAELLAQLQLINVPSPLTAPPPPKVRIVIKGAVGKGANAKDCTATPGRQGVSGLTDSLVTVQLVKVQLVKVPLPATARPLLLVNFTFSTSTLPLALPIVRMRLSAPRCPASCLPGCCFACRKSRSIRLKSSCRVPTPCFGE